MDMVGGCYGGARGAERDWRMWLLSVMDRRQRQSVRSFKMCWQAAKGALSLSGVDCYRQDGNSLDSSDFGAS